MKQLFVFFFMFLFFNFAYSQDDTAVNWIDFKNVAEDFQQKQKPVFVFCYQKNDTLSEKMFNEVLKNPEVARYINALFYPVKFNIKTTDTLTFFNGSKFIFDPKKAYHSLTYQLLGDSISTPAIVLFNKQAQGRTFYGYKNRDTLFSMLIYYAEDVYMSTKFEHWKKLYFSAYPPGKKQIVSILNIKWMSMQEMLDAQKTEKRKVFIDIYNNFNVSQTVMRLKVYNEPDIAKYLNKNFYSVSLNFKSDEVFTFNDVRYKNSGKAHKYHEFAIAALQGNMHFPAFVVLDENLKLLERVQVFLKNDVFENIIKYYGDDIYKKMDFKAYADSLNIK